MISRDCQSHTLYIYGFLATNPHTLYIWAFCKFPLFEEGLSKFSLKRIEMGGLYKIYFLLQSGHTHTHKHTHTHSHTLMGLYKIYFLLQSGYAESRSKYLKRRKIYCAKWHIHCAKGLSTVQKERYIHCAKGKAYPRCKIAKVDVVQTHECVWMCMCVFMRMFMSTLQKKVDLVQTPHFYPLQWKFRQSSLRREEIFKNPIYIKYVGFLQETHVYIVCGFLSRWVSWYS